eukprot:4460480-Prymnesium_polylepis.1
MCIRDRATHGSISRGQGAHSRLPPRALRVPRPAQRREAPKYPRAALGSDPLLGAYAGRAHAAIDCEALLVAAGGRERVDQRDVEVGVAAHCNKCRARHGVAQVYGGKKAAARARRQSVRSDACSGLSRRARGRAALTADAVQQLDQLDALIVLARLAAARHERRERARPRD